MAENEQGYQRGEPKNWLIAVWGAGSVVALVLSIVGIQFYFDHVKEQQVFQQQQAPVSNDLIALRAREDAQLHTYGYIDRNKGQVRIPIERAMELLAAEAAAGKLPYSTKPAPVVVKPPEGGAGAPPPATAAR